MKRRSSLTDERLVQDACGGDYPSFEGLVDRYEGLVYSFALFTLQDQDKAEELTFWTFVRAAEDLGGFHCSDTFGTWLLAIAFRETRKMRDGEGGRVPL